jgi:hypothetical protein
MDEDQLFFHPADPPSPKRPSDAEMIMARLARLPTREDLWRAVLPGCSVEHAHASARAPVAVVIGGGGPCASCRVNQSGPRAFAFDCNGARGQRMVSAKRTFAATRGTLVGDILWLAVIAGVFAIIVLY